MTRDNLLQARLEKISGSGRVLPGSSVPGLYNPLSVSGAFRRPEYVVRPSNLKEVKKLVSLANKQGLNLVPRSSTGDFTTVSSPHQSWIMTDLSGMDRILNIDERNRAARIEPGVRFGALQEALRKRGLRAAVPFLPRSGKSVLASFLEREPPLIPRFEYSEPILTMEVVLPNGDIFRTGSASGPASLKKTRASLVGPHGPSVIDFFRLFQGAQGTLGIVTWMNIKLEHLPVKERNYYIPCGSLAAAVELMYRVQRRMIGYECLAVGGLLLACAAARETSDIRALAGELPAFTVIVCLGGGRRRPEERLSYEDEALQETCSELGLERRKELSCLDSSFSFALKGRGQEKADIRHKLSGASLDVKFMTTMDRAEDCLAGFRSLMQKYGFPEPEPFLYLQPVEYGRACRLELGLPFRPGTDSETKARSIARESAGVISRAGGFFSEPRGLFSEWVSERASSNTEARRKLKKILDPRNVMNPGAI